MRIDEHRSYAKKFEMLPRKIQVAVRERTALFIQDRRNPLLRDHALIGNLKSKRAFSVTGDYRIVYEEHENGEVVFLFLDVDTHAKIYD